MRLKPKQTRPKVAWSSFNPPEPARRENLSSDGVNHLCLQRDSTYTISLLLLYGFSIGCDVQAAMGYVPPGKIASDKISNNMMDRDRRYGRPMRLLVEVIRIALIPTKAATGFKLVAVK